MDQLLDRALDLSFDINKNIKKFLTEDVSAEHPLREIAWGVQRTAIKIKGALGHDGDEPWPPDAIFADDSLVRLKKSRDYLRDALLAMNSADEENLAPVEWRIAKHRDISEILCVVQKHIQDLRDVLKDSEDEI